MKVIDQTVPGDLMIAEDARCSAMVNGTLTIAAGARAEVTGMVNGNLVVESGATVAFTGVVNGDLVNRGTVEPDTGLVNGRRRGGAAE